MKRFLGVFLALIMVAATVVSCAPAASITATTASTVTDADSSASKEGVGTDAPELAPKPGAIVGEAKAYTGLPLKLGVSFEGNKITEIQILKMSDTKWVGQAAIQQVIDDVIKYQSVNVDVMAGATISSKAAIEAVTNAIKLKGLDPANYQKKPAKEAASTKTIEMKSDVVVIGAGGAGLAAAVSANQNGAKVIVFEKMPRIGGNTVISGAAYNAVDPKRQKAAGVEDSIDKFYTQMYEGGDKKAKPELVRTFVENAYPALEWLESLGMKFNDTIFTVLGALWPRSHQPSDPVGTGYFNTYMNYINEHSEDVKLYLNTEVTEIIKENGRVVGVKAKNADGMITAYAVKGVIDAAGGFGANVEMRNKYNKIWPDLTSIGTTNQPGATGDGMIMAEEIGANLIDMQEIQLLPMGDPITGSLSGNIEQSVENRIFVNKSGNRFVDEGARRDVMTKGLFQQEDGFMWVIVDKHSYPTGDVKNNFSESIDQLVAEGRAYKADTIEDLAKQIGVDPKNLKNAVDTFNKAVDKSIVDPFGRTLFKHKLDTPPYYAGARKPTVHHTMGGVEITTSAQVLDKNGKVIPGLYAAGEVTGGIHGGNRLGGNAVPDTVIFGKIAGESAALGK
ncbi:flavocytochrome c [Anaerosolibacter carboniphilus]|uniref:Urocanate reductase n=1 Tax=Anaerosolibacter carboniphilus TaxID=1417629 RepID=A0A841KLK3_9FIRM|nr:flavocytochrome c [Anaerosolibacter carboniphilus]MBB6214276.1 flavocytochrome c [Anaerosolibacter carboniphilus]